MFILDSIGCSWRFFQIFPMDFSRISPRNFLRMSHAIILGISSANSPQVLQEHGFSEFSAPVDQFQVFRYEACQKNFDMFLRHLQVHS